MKKKTPEFTKLILESSNVCSGCGGKLEGLETVDNSGRPTVWAGCKKCSCFDNGVSVKVFEIARKLVVEDHERPYSHMQESEYKTEAEKSYFWDSQTRGMTRLVKRILYLANEVVASPHPTGGETE